MTALAVRDLGVTAGGEPLVRGVSFNLDPGQCVTLVGASGSGKTTVLRAVLGLLAPGLHATGELASNTGAPVPLAAAARLRGTATAWIPQEAQASLDPVRTLGAQLEEVRAQHGTPMPVAALLERAGLDAAVASLHAHALSGGMAQRTCLALALATGAPVLVADEPTASLDPPARREWFSTVRGLLDAGRSLLLATHDLALAGTVDPTMIVLEGGEEIERGDASALFHTPQHPTTMTLVAAARRSAEALPR